MGIITEPQSLIIPSSVSVCDGVGALTALEKTERKGERKTR